MAKIEKLEVTDKTGLLKNINDILDEFRNDNIKACAITYMRKDNKVVRTFRNGFDIHVLVGILEQLKFDVLSDTESINLYDFEESLNDETD